jgi:tetratricopeptide (TPR) repeat protein
LDALKDATKDRSSPLNDQALMLQEICHQQVAVIYFHNQQWDKASSHFHSAIKLMESSGNRMKEKDDKEKLVIYAYLGQTLFHLEQYDEAVMAFGRSLLCLSVSF